MLKRKYKNSILDFIKKYEKLFYNEEENIISKVNTIGLLIKNNIITKFGLLALVFIYFFYFNFIGFTLFFYMKIKFSLFLSGFIYFFFLNFIGLILFFYKKKKIDEEFFLFFIENRKESKDILEFLENLERIKINIFFNSVIHFIIELGIIVCFIPYLTLRNYTVMDHNYVKYYNYGNLFSSAFFLLFFFSE